MIKNITLLCHKNGFAKQVAAELARQLDMNFFDTMDMLAFEDKPRTLAQTLDILGEEEVHKHESRIISFASEFSNAILVCESGAVDLPKNVENLKGCSLVVYLHCSLTSVLANNEHGAFVSDKEKRFWLKSKEEYAARIERSKKMADVAITSTGKSPFVVAALTIKAIGEWFEKNN